MQLSYENNPAPAMMGMLAEPLAPQLVVSRLAETAPVVPGVAVMYGTDKTKQAQLATGKDVFAGVAVFSDNLEQKPTGVVYDGTVAGQGEGEMQATMMYQVGQMLPVLQGGVCWVRAGEDVATSSLEEELECDDAGDFIVSTAGTDAKFKAVLLDIYGSYSATREDNTMLLMIRISGPQV